MKVFVNRRVYSTPYVCNAKLIIMEKILQSFYTVRFNDCDPFSHLNNARYIDYFLNAREDHLADYYQLKLTDFAKRGIGWVVSNHEIQYTRPAFYNERISIQSSLIDLGPSHLVVEMIMQDESRQINKAILRSRFTCVNITTGRKENHPEDFMVFANSVLVEKAEGVRDRV